MDYLDTLREQALATQANVTAIIKSLLTFGYETGYLIVNAGKVIKGPKIPNALSERIMSKAQAVRLVALVCDTRNRLLLTLEKQIV